MSTVIQGKPAFAPPGPFARDVAQRVKHHFRRTGRSRFGDQWQWLAGAVFVVIGLASYICLLLHPVGRLGSIGLIVLAALCAFMLIVQWGHDASHGSMSRNGWINRTVVYVCFAILGVSGALWRDRHIRLHHAVPNLPNTGIDADTMAVMRLAPNKPWKAWHRLQPLYAVLIYALGHFNLVWVADAAEFRAARKEQRREFVGWRGAATFVSGKAIHVALFLVIPWLALHPGPMLLGLGYGIASVLVAMCFVVLVVGTHISDLAEFPSPDGSGRIAHDWATHQVAVSVDWAPTSRTAALLSGGANAHVAHHLFPGYSHRHASVLSKLVAEAAQEHALPLHVTSFPGMMLGHVRHVLSLSRPPAADK